MGVEVRDGDVTKAEREGLPCRGASPQLSVQLFCVFETS